MKLRTNRRLMRDPTRTATLRRRFRQDMAARFNRLRRDIRTTIDTNDALGLRRPLVFRAAPPGAFNFPTSERKLEAFKTWLRNEINTGVLEIEAGGRWSDKYIREAYIRGVTSADAKVSRVGITVPESGLASVLRGPVHVDRVALLFTRTFTELEGVGDVTAQVLSRELAEGMALGQNPRVIARTLDAKLRTISRTRAEVIARTEIIRAHAEGTLNEFERLGLTEVEGQAELSTAGDGRVCEECMGLEGTIYSIDEARGIIPVHPACRCSFLPWLPEMRRRAA